MRKRYLLLLLTLFFGLALLAVDRYTQEQAPALSEQQNHEPDYYGEGLYNRQYDNSGKLQQTFVAARSTHYPQTKSTLFAEPLLMSADDEGQTWQVNALEGTMLDDEQSLRLVGQVEIRPLNPTQPSDDILVETSTLTYHSRQQLAETDQPVIITSPQTRINATGMTLDIARQRMEFKSQVDTRYVPQ
ncbi:LPS export ABC transporter periplasmic protein LptC [Thalassolituus pacificus]|uniref:Lipopolysaccharide export system protein LptC n=1 Tax=Thalassolituus pacificus TaxID=2975440 RepID=A0A9X2WHL6_9GAMM|nr:LPS export ABC transporter periplasmic protein LptC [Thalassolituus pacificus]MCT7360299.1 LPS export ABC transporter periplasmic protein LptC [Thalassolituus pacificus]